MIDPAFSPHTAGRVPSPSEGRVLPYDAAMMELALADAERGRGRTSPNPLCGAVIVDESAAGTGGQPVVLSRGCHARAGQDHGEVAALRPLSGTEKARGKTLYVTLEPCNHVGRTGKCTEAILQAGLRRVVIGIRDPNPLVAGGGVECLRAAGVEVTVGVLAERCQHQNRGYLRWLRSGRPHLILKAALSLDGRLAPGPQTTGAPQWLTGETARRHTHGLRDQCDAILVGAGTVLADNPQLTVRLPRDHERAGDGRQPLRVVVDGALRIAPTARVCAPGTLLFTSRAALAAQPDKAQALSARGVELCALPPPCSADVAPPAGLVPTTVDLHAALRSLGERGLLMVMCEGGAILHGALLEAGLYDEAALYLAPLFLGDAGVPLLRHFAVPSVSAAPWLTAMAVERLGADLFVSGPLQRGAFAPASDPVRDKITAREDGHVHRAG